MSELDILREEIDNLDSDVLELINHRLELARKIGREKQGQGLSTLNNARESLVLQHLEKRNQGPLTQTALHLIFKEIMAAARELQSQHKIAFLGPEASFTHLAALGHFGGCSVMMPQANVAEVFQAVEKGQCHYGMVPVENSIEGSVNHTLDLFFTSELKICAERYQTISHDLLAAGDLPLESIRTVYSHAQAFAQCRQWLRRHLPGAILTECGSTAEAARRAAAQRGQCAAIAGSAAAELYNLKVIAPKIEDYPAIRLVFWFSAKRTALVQAKIKPHFFLSPHICPVPCTAS